MQESEMSDAGQPVETEQVFKRDRFRVSLVSWVFIGLFVLNLAAQFVIVFRRSSDEMELARGLGQVCGSLFFATMFILFISWLFWSISRQSNRSANVALCIALLLANGMIRSRSAENYLENKKAMTALEQDAKIIQNKNRQLIEQSLEGDTADTDEVDAVMSEGVEMLERAADSMSGKEAVFMKALADIARNIQEKTIAYQRSSDRFIEAGAIDVALIRTREDIAKRVQMLDETIAAADESYRLYDQTAQILRSKLVSKGLNKRDIDSAIRGIRSNAQWNITPKILDCDRQIMVIYKKIFELYDKYWDDVSFDELDGSPVMNNDEFFVLYEELWSQVTEIAAKQQQLQASLVETIKK